MSHPKTKTEDVYSRRLHAMEKSIKYLHEDPVKSGFYAEKARAMLPQVWGGKITITLGDKKNPVHDELSECFARLNKEASHV